MNAQKQKWQDSRCQRHGAGERVMGEDDLQREAEEGSGVGILGLGRAHEAGGFVSELSAVTSGAPGLESIFPWGRGMGFGPPCTLCPFLTEALLAPLPMSGVSCGLVSKGTHQVIRMMFQRGKGPTHVYSVPLFLLPHMDPLSFSFGPSWGTLPPESPPRAEVVC